jgi:hypothetical protein
MCCLRRTIAGIVVYFWNAWNNKRVHLHKIYLTNKLRKTLILSEIILAFCPPSEHWLFPLIGATQRLSSIIRNDCIHQVNAQKIYKQLKPKAGSCPYD